MGTLVDTTMSKKKKELHDSPEWERYAGAQMEEMKDMFRVIVEQTSSISQIREDLDRVLTWEDDIKLIPIMFEEVGKLRQDVEILREAIKLIGKNTEEIERLVQRVDKLEQEIKTRKVA